MLVEVSELKVNFTKSLHFQIHWNKTWIWQPDTRRDKYTSYNKNLSSIPPGNN